MAPRPLAAVRVTTRISEWPKQFTQALDKVYDAVRAGRVQQSGHNVMVYYPRPDGLVDIDCGIETPARFDAVGDVRYCQTPSGTAVTAAHLGPYQQLGLTHQAVVDWSRQNGNRITGVCWEIYGDWEEDPAKLRTDIFHLLRLENRDVLTPRNVVPS